VRAVAFLDASVLYRAVTRSVLLYLAVFDVFRPLWSAAVQKEWMDSLIKNRPDLDPARIARTRALMDAHVLDANVTGYEPLIDGLTLPDPGDRHVLAAAIHGGANLIVTSNLRHFPAAALAPYGMTAEHPDAFVCMLLDADPEGVVAALAADRAAMIIRPMTPTEYLAALDRDGLVATAAGLRVYIDQLEYSAAGPMRLCGCERRWKGNPRRCDPEPKRQRRVQDLTDDIMADRRPHQGAVAKQSAISTIRRGKDRVPHWRAKHAFESVEAAAFREIEHKVTIDEHLGFCVHGNQADNF
jgi:hypothetical protein